MTEKRRYVSNNGEPPPASVQQEDVGLAVIQRSIVIGKAARECGMGTFNEGIAYQKMLPGTYTTYTCP